MKQQLLGAATSALLFLAAPAAHAVAMLAFQVDGGPILFCADNDAACDNSALVGVVSFNDPIGPVFVNVTTGVSKPVVTGNPLIDLNSITITATGDHTVILAFSDNDFDAQGQFSGAFGGTLNGAGATIEASAYYSAGNLLFAQTNLMDTLGPFSGLAFSDTFVDAFAPGGPYSVSLFLTLNTSSTENTTFSGDFAVSIPEPTTLALLGLGLLAFGVRLGRRAV